MKKLVRLARAVLEAREAFPRNMVTERAAEAEFWAACATREEKAVAAKLKSGGLSDFQAQLWTGALITGERDDQLMLELEADEPRLCEVCGGELTGSECPTCGIEPSRAWAKAVVHALVDAGRLELVTSHAVSGLVNEAWHLLDRFDASNVEQAAAVLEEAWLRRPDVAELYADRDEIIEALRRLTIIRV